MAKLDRILKSKSLYIVISILLGIMTWLLVLNYTNPSETRTLEIPLAVLNENAPIELGLSDRGSQYDKVITVKVSGRSDIIGNLTTRDLHAEVDFNQIKSPGTTVLNIKKPECSRLGIKIDNYYPKSIELKYDAMTQRSVDVKVEYDDSLLKKGYEFISVTAEPSSVQISGFASDIDGIDCIKVNLGDSLPVSSIDSNRTGVFIGHYFLTGGQDVTANFETEKVAVKIEVGKRVPISYSVSGVPHENFYITNSTISNGTALLLGSADDLRNINEINLGRIDISSATENVVKSFAIADFLPAGVTAYQLTETYVTVNILEYKVKAFNVSISRHVSTPGKDTKNFVYSFDPENFTVSIKGKASDLASLSIASLEPILDLTNKGVGEYIIPLEFMNINKEKFTIIGEYVCAVKIEEYIEPTSSPSQPPEPTPTGNQTEQPDPTGEHGGDPSADPRPTPDLRLAN